MLKLIGKLVLFILPLGIVLFAFPFAIYYLGREFVSIPSILQAQSGSQEVLTGFAYSTVTRGYKEALVSERKPTIIALGTSRVYEFHDSFFSNPSEFVNAGGIIPSAEYYSTELTTLSDSDPNLRVVIVSLDPWLFDPNHVESDSSEQDTPLERLDTFFAGNWRTSYTDYLQKKFTIRGLIAARSESPDIGLPALVTHNGYLNDGSFYYGKSIADTSSDHGMTAAVTPVVNEIKADRGSYEYATSTSQESIDDLKKMYAVAQSRGIYVVGFVPPHQQEVYDELVSQNDAYAAEVRRLPRELAAVSANYGYPVFDYTDPSSVGILPDEFIDEVHSTDVATLRMLIDMAQHDKTLASYVSLPSLENTLAQAKGPFLLTGIK